VRSALVLDAFPRSLDQLSACLAGLFDGLQTEICRVIVLLEKETALQLRPRVDGGGPIGSAQNVLETMKPAKPATWSAIPRKIGVPM